MLSTFRLMALWVAFILVVGVSRPASGAKFNDRQKAEIGEIVREYLLKNPEILRDVFQELDRRQREGETALGSEQIAKNATEIFHSKHDLVVGDPRGDMTLVEFFDYNCGYCQKSMADVRKLIESDPKLRVVFKELPILGPGSVFAAKASIAAMKQGKFQEFHEALFEFKGRKDEASFVAIAKSVGIDVDRMAKDMNAPEVAAIIERNVELAGKININGTPAFVIGTELIPGAVGFEALAAKIAEVREAGGCAIC